MFQEFSPTHLAGHHTCCRHSSPFYRCHVFGADDATRAGIRAAWSFAEGLGPLILVLQAKQVLKALALGVLKDPRRELGSSKLN